MARHGGKVAHGNTAGQTMKAAAPRQHLPTRQVTPREVTTQLNSLCVSPGRALKNYTAQKILRPGWPEDNGSNEALQVLLPREACTSAVSLVE